MTEEDIEATMDLQALYMMKRLLSWMNTMPEPDREAVWAVLERNRKRVYEHVAKAQGDAP